MSSKIQWKTYANRLAEQVGSDKDPQPSVIEEGLGALRADIAIRMGARITVSDPAFTVIAENLDRQRVLTP